MLIKRSIFGWCLGALIAYCGIGAMGVMELGVGAENLTAKVVAEEEITSKIALGELLFNEKRLSIDTTISCASCHIPQFAFADTAVLSKGVKGKLGTRNTPSVTNISARPLFFYDGRASSLEHQVHFPVNNVLEMGFSITTAVNRLRKDRVYRRYFKAIYGHAPDSASLVDAIAAFERTLETSNTPFDRWMAGDSSAMSASAIRGRNLFMDSKSKCFDCHFSPDFTGDEFRNIGLYNGSGVLNDVGRFAITKDSSDLGRFRVPGLRNVAVTAPYMHNGMFKTLREVVDYYDNPFQHVNQPINIDTLLQKPLSLSKQEKDDLVAFLEALTDIRFTSK